jgi:hypothetical protein
MTKPLNIGLLMVAAVAEAGFFRCGRFWPKAGVVVDPREFTEEDWERLAAEPMLHITPAPDTAELAAAEASLDLNERIKAAIGTLEAGDFEADGRPKLGAVKERLPEDARKVTAKVLAEVWADLKPAD